jgi:transposase-like protein
MQLLQGRLRNIYKEEEKEFEERLTSLCQTGVKVVSVSNKMKNLYKHPVLRDSKAHLSLYQISREENKGKEVI